MASRRMVSKDVIESDRFFDIPLEVQALYMHLLVNADDDGFIGNPKTIIRMTGSNMESLKQLVESGFLIEFESGAIVIVDWKIQNKVQPSKKKDTIFQNEKKLLRIGERERYSIYGGLPEQDSTVQDGIAETSAVENISVDNGIKKQIVDAWNTRAPIFNNLKTIDGNCEKKLGAAINKWSIDEVFNAISNADDATFRKVAFDQFLENM